MRALDSSVAIEVLRTRPNRQIRNYMQAALEVAEPLWISSIVVHELMTGALKGDRVTQDLERLDQLLSRLTIAEMTADDAISAARVGVELERRGTKIGPLDTLIAGQALARDWALVTTDLQHFLRVDGLTIIDWTRSDQPIERPDVLAQMLRTRPKEEK